MCSSLFSGSRNFFKTLLVVFFFFVCFLKLGFR